MLPFHINATPTLSDHQKHSIYTLWNAEYPAQIRYGQIEELDTYLEKLDTSTHYFALYNETTIAWACTFIREHEQWFAIIVDKYYHGKKVGSALLELLKETHSALNGWVTDRNNYIKTNGEPYPSPLDFYLKNDFQILYDQRLDTEHLSAVKIRWVSPHQRTSS